MTVGLDANIICYALDDAYPEHEKLKCLLLDLSPENKNALNPTTIHEAYHTHVLTRNGPGRIYRNLKVAHKKS